MDNRLKRPHFKESKRLNGIGWFQETSEIKRGNISFVFFTPNVLSILIENTIKSSDKIVQLRKQIFSEIKTGNDKVEIIENNSNLAIDFIQAAQEGIIFSYTALEAYLNLVIPQNLQLEEINGKGIKELYNKENIIRWFNNLKKLEVIIREYKLDDFIPEKVINDLKILQKLRNDIIHLKDIDINELKDIYFRKDLASIIFNVHQVISNLNNRLIHLVPPSIANHLPIAQEDEIMHIEVSENFNRVRKR